MNVNAPFRSHYCQTELASDVTLTEAAEKRHALPNRIAMLDFPLCFEARCPGGFELRSPWVCGGACAILYAPLIGSIQFPQQSLETLSQAKLPVFWNVATGGSRARDEAAA